MKGDKTKVKIKHTLGKISLFVAIAGIELPLFLHLLLHFFISPPPIYGNDNALMKSSIVFFSMQVLAAVTGILGWQSVYGKLGVLVSIVHLVIGILFWFFLIGRMFSSMG